MAFMRTESRVTGAGPHPGGAARWARRGMRSHPDFMASRPAGRFVCSAVGLGSSTARRAAGSGSSSRWCSWRESDARLGWDRRAQLRDADCGLIGTPYRQQPLGQFAGPCHRVRPPDPLWEATPRATHDGIAGPRARARGRRKDFHRHLRLSIGGRYHLAPY